MGLSRFAAIMILLYFIAKIAICYACMCMTASPWRPLITEPPMAWHDRRAWEDEPSPIAIGRPSHIIPFSLIVCTAHEIGEMCTSESPLKGWPSVVVAESSESKILSILLLARQRLGVGTRSEVVAHATATEEQVRAWSFSRLSVPAFFFPHQHRPTEFDILLVVQVNTPRLHPSCGSCTVIVCPHRSITYLTVNTRATPTTTRRKQRNLSKRYTTTSNLSSNRTRKTKEKVTLKATPS